MNGRPWMRLLLVVAGFGLMGFPVWNLTHRDAAYAQPVAEAAGPMESLSIILSFSPSPEQFSLTHVDDIILEGRYPAAKQAKAWKVSIPAEGLDLLLKTQWPKGTSNTTAQVKIFQKETLLVEKTFSGERDLVEMVTIPGKAR